MWQPLTGDVRGETRLAFSGRVSRNSITERNFPRAVATSQRSSVEFTNGKRPGVRLTGRRPKPRD